MSDRYLFHFNFALSHEAPEALTRSLGLRAEGTLPTEEDVAGLPGLVGTYLRTRGVAGDGVYHFERQQPLRRAADGTFVPDDSKAHLRTFDLHMAHTFHDDEYSNAAISRSAASILTERISI